MLFMNEETKEYARLYDEEAFEKWSAEMDINDILVCDTVGVWWYYTDYMNGVYN